MHPLAALMGSIGHFSKQVLFCFVFFFYLTSCFAISLLLNLARLRLHVTQIILFAAINIFDMQNDKHFVPPSVSLLIMISPRYSKCFAYLNHRRRPVKVD